MPETLPPIRADLGPEGLHIDRSALSRSIQALPLDAPIAALIHGFSFMPDLPGQCPHQHILSLNPTAPDRHAISWPRHLGLDGKRGLAIACGWPARGSVWKAYGRAECAGWALAELAELVVGLGRRLDVVCHSMGARVALSALPHTKAGAFGKVILLAGAETRKATLSALDSPAGRAAEFANVTTRENDLFDALFEWLIHCGRGTSVGQGLPEPHLNWRDLWLDRPETLAGLRACGHSVAPAVGRVSHWSPYLRPGVFPVYRALLTGALPLQALPQSRPDRRWSRLLMPRPIKALALPQG